MYGTKEQVYGRLPLTTQLVQALRYKPEGRGFDSHDVTGILHLHNLSGLTMALGLTRPITEMSTRNISREVKAAGA